MTGGAKKGLLYIVGLGILINAGVYFLSVRSVNSLAVQQHAQCKFYDDLGSSPITAVPGAKASILGVSLVSDARVAWHRLGCSGTQQPAAPSFLQWAAYYKLPAD
jgi:hypothetical protein